MSQLAEYTFGKNLKTSKYRLPNGLKVIVMEDHSVPVFAYHTWFNVGSRNEREGITGIAHLFEHLMFKETKNHKEGEYDRVLEEEGGSINAATYLDWTFYRASLPKGAFEKVVNLEADRMQNMILNDTQVNSEREVVANERRFRVDNNPGGLMSEKLYATAFKKHPYYWPVIGWMRDIEAIQLKDCLDFYKTYYAPNNATIVVVGDLNTDQVLATIEKYYAQIPPSSLPEVKLPVEPEQKEERRATMELTIPAEKLLMAYHIPEFTSPEFYTLTLLQTLLFDGKSARLQKRLISDAEVASDVSGYADQTRNPGLFQIDISMKPGISSKKAEMLIDEEIDKLKKNLVPALELEKAKNRLETSFWEHFGTADDKAQNLGYYELVTGDYQNIFHEMDKLSKITAQDIQSAVIKYFKSTNRTVLNALPKGEAQKG